ncbi:MAG: NTP transferase domain-containing protein [Fimbriimonadaceae bacterium]|nr:NTP transferase domain-containing protein [Fimbriimonadaceae bacterium]
MKAVVTAGGRSTGALAELTGTALKCCIAVQGQRLIDRVLAALHGARQVSGVTVVGPPELASDLALEASDQFITEADSGPANFLLGLRAVAAEPRIVFVTSDLPFVTAAAIDDLIDRCPEGYGMHYPIWSRQELQAQYPTEEGNYLRLAEGELTGSSAMVFEPRRILDKEAEITALFNARKDFGKLFGLLGPGLALRLAVWKLLRLPVVSVERLVARFQAQAGFPCRVVRGADPCLSFDLDHERDWADVQHHLAWLSDRAEAG